MNQLGIERLALLNRGEILAPNNGRCRVCFEPLPKHRRGYCTDECRDAYYLATSTDFLRFKVFERDKGICKNCNLDCDALEQRVFGFSTMVKKPRRKQQQAALLRPHELRSAMVSALVAQGFTRLTSNRPHTLWEADHIEPLNDGGSWSLDNVATLCQPCHIAKTSDEATWRAKRRKLVGKKQTETMKRFKRMGL